MALEVTGLVKSVQPKSVSILGSTGSIGCNTIDLITRSRDAFRLEALTANNNVDLLAAQARDLNARLAVIANPDLYRDLKDSLSGSGIEVAAGSEALTEAAARPADWVMAAIVGAAGLAPTLEAVRRGATVGLANKECLVSAGEIFMNEVEHHGATLVPVDSQAVAHPNWDMGAKISIDSATMMNKGLELIEAYHIFPIDEPQIEILVHPQSVIHSMVEYVDASVLAQLGAPDMRTPIAYAMAWPERMAAPSPRLSLAEIGSLTFEMPDLDRFPALRLAREALRAGGSAPITLNAANEIAVHQFLTGQLGFLEISETVEKTLEATPVSSIHTLEDVMQADEEARQKAQSVC